MKPITQLILIVLLTFTVVPVYGDDLKNGKASAFKNIYKGMWACMSTKYFGYKDGEIKHYTDEKFIMKIMEDTISFSGDKGLSGRDGKKYNIAPMDIILKSPFLGAVGGGVELFHFEDGAFGRVSIFSPEITYTQIGTCEKFDDPE